MLCCGILEGGKNRQKTSLSDAVLSKKKEVEIGGVSCRKIFLFYNLNPEME